MSKILFFFQLLVAVFFSSFSFAQTCPQMKYLIGGYFPSFSPSGRWIGAQQNGQIWIHDLGTNGLPPAVINSASYLQNMGDVDSRLAMGDSHSLFMRKDGNGNVSMMLAEHNGGNPRNGSSLYVLSTHSPSAQIQIHPPAIDETGQVAAWAEQDRVSGDLHIYACKLNECKNQIFYTHKFQTGLLDPLADIYVMPAITLGQPIVFVQWYKQRFGAPFVWGVYPSKVVNRSAEIELFSGTIFDGDYRLIRPSGNSFQYIIAFNRSYGAPQKGVRYRVIDLVFKFVSGEVIFSKPNPGPTVSAAKITGLIQPSMPQPSSSTYDWAAGITAASTKNFIYFVRATTYPNPTTHQVFMQTLGGKTIPVQPVFQDIWGLTSSSKGAVAIWEQTGTYLSYCQ